MKGGVSFAGHTLHGDKMKGYFAIEALFVLFLLPYIGYLASTPPIILPRETAELCHDIAQLYSYGLSPPAVPNHALWIDGESIYYCNYTFKYCTLRYIPSAGREVRICLAECSPS